MTISSRQYASLASDSYVERPPGAARPKDERPVVDDGVQFSVLEYYDNPKTGYQGAIYQRADTKEIVVAHRGTEFGREPKQDGLGDGAMVIARVNAQIPEDIVMVASSSVQTKV